MTKTLSFCTEEENSIQNPCLFVCLIEAGLLFTIFSQRLALMGARLLLAWWCLKEHLRSLWIVISIYFAGVICNSVLDGKHPGEDEIRCYF